MEKFNEQLLGILERAGEYFAVEAVSIFTANIRKQKILNTRQLLDSLSSENKTDLSRVVHSISFAFIEYGKFLDIKGKKWNKMPPIEYLLEWVKSKGLVAFGPDPKPNKKKPKTSEKRMNEIAWGIAKQMTMKKDPIKAKPWFNNSFYRALNALQEEIAIGVADRSFETMKETLLWRLKKGATGNYF